MALLCFYKPMLYVWTMRGVPYTNARLHLTTRASHQLLSTYVHPKLTISPSARCTLCREDRIRAPRTRFGLVSFTSPAAGVTAVAAEGTRIRAPRTIVLVVRAAAARAAARAAAASWGSRLRRTQVGSSGKRQPRSEPARRADGTDGVSVFWGSWRS